MDTKLLDRILSDARDKAPNPAAAMAIEDLMRDVRALADALDTHSLEGDELAGLPAAFDALAKHVETQPFDVVHNEDDEEGRVIVSELTPGAFEEWLGELERLAQ